MQTRERGALHRRLGSRGVCPEGVLVIAEGIDERDVRFPHLNRVKLRVKKGKSFSKFDGLMPQGCCCAAGHDDVDNDQSLEVSLESAQSCLVRPCCPQSDDLRLPSRSCAV